MKLIPLFCCDNFQLRRYDFDGPKYSMSDDEVRARLNGMERCLSGRSSVYTYKNSVMHDEEYFSRQYSVESGGVPYGMSCISMKSLNGFKNEWCNDLQADRPWVSSSSYEHELQTGAKSETDLVSTHLYSFLKLLTTYFRSKR